MPPIMKGSEGAVPRTPSQRWPQRWPQRWTQRCPQRCPRRPYEASAGLVGLQDARSDAPCRSG
eukprot:2010118-Alexandrium_andersonii.AAC.1